MTTLPSSPQFWAIVPAAGAGKRMGGQIPKQYLNLLGKTIIEYTLHSLLSYSLVQKVVVAIAPDDPHWPTIQNTLPYDKIITVQGGKQRFQSVHQGLQALIDKAHVNDWVLVHDAVRPCL